MKILVVCMGNICRSPTGEAVLRGQAEKRRMLLEVDSAGTIDYHQGKRPDSRAIVAGENRGYSFRGIIARQLVQQDFDYFDLILTADRQNLADVNAICPAKYRHKLSLFLSHANLNVDEIPDPYYGGEEGFEKVLDLIEAASDALLDKLVAHRV